MSMPVGALFVYAEPGPSPEAVEALARRIWPLEREEDRDGQTRWDVSKALVGGWLRRSKHPMGFCLLELRLSANALIDDGAEAAWDSIERFFALALAELPPLFGAFTTYGTELESSWVEDRVLTPLLLEEWDDLRVGLPHLVLAPPALRWPGARELAETSAGRLLSTGPSRRPYSA